ncbi:MAG: hypothetical protein ABWZ64_19325 [Xanthobacteraceae bacterium]
MLQFTAIHCHVGGMVRSEQEMLGYVDEVADQVKMNWASNRPFLISEPGDTDRGRDIEFDRRLAITFQAPVPSATIGIRRRDPPCAQQVHQKLDWLRASDEFVLAAIDRTAAASWLIARPARTRANFIASRESCVEHVRIGRSIRNDATLLKRTE